MRNPQAPSRPRGPISRRRVTPESLLASTRWSPEQKSKIEKVMSEYKAGSLDDGHGGRVTSKKQAVAIALSEARGLTAAGGRRGRFEERKHKRKRKGAKGGGRFDFKLVKDTIVDIEDAMTLLDWTNPALDRLARTPAQKRAAGATAAAFVEEDHPRDPGGEGGGQFVFKTQRTRVSDDEGGSWRDETPEEFTADLEKHVADLASRLAGAEKDMEVSYKRGDMFAIRAEHKASVERAKSILTQAQAVLEKVKKGDVPPVHKDMTASGRFDRPALRAAGTWDESKHPRHDEGSPQGGQFSAKDAVDKADSGGDRLPGDDGGEAARQEIKDRRARARKQIEEMSGRTPTEAEITEALDEEDRIARGPDDDEDYQEFKTAGDKIMAWDEDQKTWVQVGNAQDDPDFYEEIAGAEGAQEDDGEVDPFATDYDEAGGDEVQRAPLTPELETKAAEIVDSIGSRIEESMEIGEGLEGYGDEESQGRGYGDQVDEEIAMAMDAYWDEFGLSDEDTDALYPEVEKRLRAFLTQDGTQASGALTASAAGLTPDTPPKSWFEKPQLEGPTGITVTADGRVYGHAALWDTCHTGMPGVCRTPPRSSSNYRFFHLGEVDTDGGPVAVGRVTMDTGHAPLTASRDGAIRHYDDTGTGIAHVRAYEDDHGIVLAGALVPGAPADKARRFKGATVSGDWRSIQGKLELVGMLAVNVPGFPVPRAMAASLVVEDEPHVMALVAAGAYRDEEADRRKLKALTARALGGVDGLAAAAGYQSKSRRRMGVTAAGRPFDESKHPRHPRGSEHGGRWARVTRTDGSGEVTYRQGLASQVVKELREEGEVISGGPDDTVKVAPMPEGQTPEEDARVRSGEPGFVQDTVEISKHGLKYRGTIVKVTPGAAMVEYTTNNGKTKTIRVPHREYKVVP